MRTDKEFDRMVQSEVGFTMWICGFNHFDRAELRQAMPTMIILQMKSPTQYNNQCECLSQVCDY